MTLIARRDTEWYRCVYSQVAIRLELLAIPDGIARRAREDPVFMWNDLLKDSTELSLSAAAVLDNLPEEPAPADRSLAELLRLREGMMLAELAMTLFLAGEVLGQRTQWGSLPIGPRLARLDHWIAANKHEQVAAYVGRGSLATRPAHFNLACYFTARAAYADSAGRGDQDLDMALQHLRGAAEGQDHRFIGQVRRDRSLDVLAVQRKDDVNRLLRDVEMANSRIGEPPSSTKGSDQAERA